MSAVAPPAPDRLLRIVECQRSIDPADAIAIAPGVEIGRPRAVQRLKHDLGVVSFVVSLGDLDQRLGSNTLRAEIRRGEPPAPIQRKPLLRIRHSEVPT